MGDGTEQNQRTIDNVKTEQLFVFFLQVRSTPCKCCSRSQQRSSSGLRLRLTALLVLIERVCMVNVTFSHHFFWTWYLTKHISHTCGKRSCRPTRYLLSSSYSQISKRCLATALRVSSSITTGHYVLKQRRGSRASDFRKQCHEGSTISSHIVTPLV